MDPKGRRILGGRKPVPGKAHAEVTDWCLAVDAVKGELANACSRRQSQHDKLPKDRRRLTLKMEWARLSYGVTTQAAKDKRRSGYWRIKL